MAYDSSKPLKKAGTQPAPQYWNEDIGDWEVVTGANGAYSSQSPIDVAEDTFSGTGTLTKEFASEMNGIVISNDGNADLTFTVLGKTRTVKAGEVYEGKFRPFTTITITVTGTVPWRADAIQTIGAIPAVVTPPDTTAPDNVTNLVASAVTQTTLTLTWTASASGDVAGYDIYRGVTLLTTVTGNTYNVTGLTQNTSYTFTVKAKDASDNVATGTQVTAQTADAVPDTTAPDPVTSLATGTATATTIPLTWTDSVSGDVASFEVAFSTNGTNFNVAAASLSSTETSYTVTGLTESTAYTLRVVAIDSANNRSTAATVTKTTTAAADTTAPNPITSLAAGTVTSTTIPLTWTLSSSGDVATQEVAYSTDGTAFTVASAAVSASSTSYTVTGLTASTAYTLRVVAVDGVGNRSTAVTVAGTTAAAQSVAWVTSGIVTKWDNRTTQLSLTNNGTYFPASTDFTVVATLKVKAFLNVISQYDIGKVAESVVRLNVDSTAKKLTLSMWGTNNASTGYFPGFSSGSDIFADTATYYHVALVRNATTVKLYVNNVLYGTVTLTSPPFTLNANINTVPLKIADATSDVKTVVYYSRELSSTELTQNYNALI